MPVEVNLDVLRPGCQSGICSSLASDREGLLGQIGLDIDRSPLRSGLLKSCEQGLERSRSVIVLIYSARRIDGVNLGGGFPPPPVSPSASLSVATAGTAARTTNATAMTASAARSFLEVWTPPPGHAFRFHSIFLPPRRARIPRSACLPASPLRAPALRPHGIRINDCESQSRCSRSVLLPADSI